MKKNLRGIIYFVICAIVVCIYITYRIKRTEKVMEQLKKEYPSISINEKIYSTVLKVYNGDPKVSRNNPHHAYLIFDNSTKRRIRTGYELALELTLDEVLLEGDLLVKKRGTDTLHIYRIRSDDTLLFTFQLRNDMGYPLEKGD